VAADSTGDDYDRDLAQWLEESGRRHGSAQPASPAELLAYLERLTGSRLRSLEDVRLYVAALEEGELQRRRVAAARRTVREAVFLLLLAVAAAQYLYLDLLLQAETLQRVIYFVPVAKTSQRS
jgi:hypothetical protein